MLKRVIGASVLSIGMMLSATAIAADAMGGVGVVDMQSILHSAPQVEKINMDLKNQFSARKDMLLASAKALQANMTKLSKNKAVMSKMQMAALQKTVGDQEMKLRMDQMKYQQDLLAAQNEAMNGFLTELKMAVQKVATMKHLDVVLPKNSLLYANDNTDVTPSVLDNLKGK